MPSKATKLLWDLLCDVPQRRRLKTRLVVLKVYFDESGTGQPPVFVMGGLLSTAERWASFSDQWQEVLDIPPRLEYFKMEEAMNLSGQFHHWSEERRDHRVKLLDEVLVNNATAAFSYSHSHEEFDRVFKTAKYRKWSYPMNSAYYHGVLSLISRIFEIRDLLGSEPIQFIFDDGIKEKAEIMDVWDEVKKNTEWYRKFNVMGHPYFLNDKTVLPLQAADLVSFLIRHRWISARTTMQQKKLPAWFDHEKNFPMYHISAMSEICGRE